MRWNIPAQPQPHLLIFGCCCFLKPTSPWDEAARLDRGRSLWVRIEEGCKWDRLLLKAACHCLPAQRGIDFSLHIYSWRLRHSMLCLHANSCPFQSLGAASIPPLPLLPAVPTGREGFLEWARWVLGYHCIPAPVSHGAAAA